MSGSVLHNIDVTFFKAITFYLLCNDPGAVYDYYLKRKAYLAPDPICILEFDHFDYPLLINFWSLAQWSLRDVLCLLVKHDN